MAGDLDRNQSSTKTIHLKAYIHCEGCKKKVLKVLNKIDGVHIVEIDARIGKLSVTGTTDVETLIKKLEKSGKVVELWPEPHLPVRLTPSISVSQLETKLEKAKDKNEKIAQPQASPEKQPTGDTSNQVTPAIISTLSCEKKRQGEEGKEADRQVSASVIKSSSKSGSKQSVERSKDGALELNLERNKARILQGDDDLKLPEDHAASHSNESSNKETKATKSSATLNAIYSNKHSVADKAHKLDDEEASSPYEKQQVKDEEKSINKPSNKNLGEECTSSYCVNTMMGGALNEGVTITNTAIKHMAPPTMVLMETARNSTDLVTPEDYAVDMFSDENANSCTLM